MAASYSVRDLYLIRTEYTVRTPMDGGALGEVLALAGRAPDTAKYGGATVDARDGEIRVWYERPATPASSKITPEVAEGVLWFHGHADQHTGPGSTYRAVLLDLIARADPTDRDLLRRVYPAHVAAMERAATTDGIEDLKKIVEVS